MPEDETKGPGTPQGDAALLATESRPGPEAHLDEWVAPDIADERGFLRAGKILEWMDVVGVLAASRHCRRPVATASVDGMELLHARAGRGRRNRTEFRAESAAAARCTPAPLC